jgi:hypothetical protein
MKINEKQNNWRNSIDKRKINTKNSNKMNHSLINSNRNIEKNENKNSKLNNNTNNNSNTKLLYEKMKKKTYTNNFKKIRDQEKKSENFIKFSSSFKKRDSLNLKNTQTRRKNSTRKKNNGNISERRFSTNNSRRPILSLDDISASYNKIKEKRNQILNKFKKDKISSKDQALLILSTSPVLRLCEQIILSKSTKNMRKEIKLEYILNNHNIYLNAKANELKNEIYLCEKSIKTPFVASKIADITLNFITSTDEEEFKEFDILESNKETLVYYYNYIKLLYILFDEKYDSKASGKNIKLKLFEKIKEKGFQHIKDYLYHIYIAKKEENNIITKVEIINNDIIKNSPNLLDFHETLKICRFAAFTNYLIKEIITYANNVNDMIELKFRAKNLLDIVMDKIEKIRKKIGKNEKNQKK